MERPELNEVQSGVIASRLPAMMDEAERKAIDALGRYKFAMFGYWAATWVHLNQISGLHRPNPFKALVLKARDTVAK